MPTYFIIITHPGTHKEGFEWRKEKMTKKVPKKVLKRRNTQKGLFFLFIRCKLSLSLHIHRSSSVNGKLGFTDFEGQVCKIENLFWWFRILETQAFQLLLAIDQPNEFSLAFGISIFESKFKFGGFWNAFGSGSIQRLLRNIHNDACTGQAHTLYIHIGKLKKLFQNL